MEIGRVIRIVVAAAIYFALNGPASAVNWTNCGQEHKSNCTMPNAESVVMRYGDSATGNYFYYGFSGETSQGCSNFNGDPMKGVTKACAYTTGNTGTYDTTWNGKCADENKSCAAPATPTWVRYGKNSRWFVGVQSGNFSCSNGQFGTDPYKGTTKECQLGGPVIDGSIQWVACASENNTCTLSQEAANAGALLRYGFGDKWLYRVATIASIQCSNGVFGKDPNKGQTKVCEYATLPPNAVTMGDWTQVGSCNGKCTIAETVAYGSEHSQSTTTTDEWSETVTTSMEAGFEIEGVGAKVNTSVANSFAHSSSFQNALSTSVSKSITVDCGEKSDDVQKLLYQFSTITDKACLNTGSCVGSTFTLDTVCVTDPPHDYQGPQCAPNDCADNICSVCKSGS